MKKLLLMMFFLLIVIAQSNADDVNDFTSFNALYKNGGTANLTADIIASSGFSVTHSSFTIKGNGKVLHGSVGTNGYNGMFFSSGSFINVSNGVFEIREFRNIGFGGSLAYGGGWVVNGSLNYSSGSVGANAEVYSDLLITANNAVGSILSSGGGLLISGVIGSAINLTTNSYSSSGTAIVKITSNTMKILSNNTEASSGLACGGGISAVGTLGASVDFTYLMPIVSGTAIMNLCDVSLCIGSNAVNGKDSSIGGGFSSIGLLSVGCSSSITADQGNVVTTITNSTMEIVNNSIWCSSTSSASVALGGGIAVAGIAASYFQKCEITATLGNSKLIIQNSTVSINGNNIGSATYQLGGGICVVGALSMAFDQAENVFVRSSSASINIEKSSVTISGNTALLGGGIAAIGAMAIGNASAQANTNPQDISAQIIFSGSDVLFEGNRANKGGAIYAAGTFSDSTGSRKASGGTVVISFNSATIFSSNSADGYGGAIYISTDAKVSFSNPSNSSITFINNTASTTNHGHDIYTDGELSILGEGDVVINGGIAGSMGSINKTSGKLFLNADCSAYLGTFNQIGGTTTVSTFGKVFSTSVITNSLLEVHVDSINYHVLLKDNGILKHYATQYDENNPIYISGNNIIMVSTSYYKTSGAKVIFGVHDSTCTAYYVLAKKLDNENDNTVEFSSSYVTLTSTDYVGGTEYEFNDATIALNLSSAGTACFTKLALKNVKLDTLLTIDSDSAKGDILKADSAKGELELGQIRIREDQDAGRLRRIRIKILEGLEFTNDEGNQRIATQAYEYEVSISKEDNTSIELDMLGPSSDLSLENMNKRTGKRAFLLLQEGAEYNVGGDLSGMGEGEFLVEGCGECEEGSKIIGISSGTGKGVSLFNIEAGAKVEFCLKDLTISSCTTLGEGSVLTIKSSGSETKVTNVTFQHNTSSKAGGAVYIKDGAASFSNVHFLDNISEDEEGGAAYIENSTVSFNVKGIGSIIMGNKGKGGSSGICLGKGSEVKFNIAAGSSFEMYDRVTSSGGGGKVEIEGEGGFNLYETSEIEGRMEVRGNLNIGNGVNLRVDEMSNKKSGVINMANGGESEIEVRGDLDNEGTIRMEMFEDGTNSKIRAGDVELKESSVLEIALYERKEFKKREYRIIESSGEIKGKFKTIFDDREIWEIEYRQKEVIVSIAGTNFGVIKGMSDNERAVARVYDDLSQKGTKGDIGEIISKIYVLKKEEDIKEALWEISGYFLANVIREGGDETCKRRIYNMIDDRKKKGSLWAQGIVDYSEYGSDENSRGKYTDRKIGAMAGNNICLTKEGDREAEKNIIVGWYVKANNCGLRQGAKRGKVTKGGCGAYGGYIRDKWEIKFVGEGSYDVYDTEREIEIGRAGKRLAKAEFKGVSVGGDIEGALKGDVGIEMQIRPYIGIEYRENRYGEIKERGAKGLDLQVESGAYKRMSARAGIGIMQSVDRLSLEATVEFKHLLFGKLPDITSEFKNTALKFKTFGAEEEKNMIGVGVNSRYNVTESIYLFAKANFFVATRYSNISGNVGAAYQF